MYDKGPTPRGYIWVREALSEREFQEYASDITEWNDGDPFKYRLLRVDGIISVQPTPRVFLQGGTMLYVGSMIRIREEGDITVRDRPAEISALMVEAQQREAPQKEI